jgi:hypothetical protein
MKLVFVASPLNIKEKELGGLKLSEWGNISISDMLTITSPMQLEFKEQYKNFLQNSNKSAVPLL